MEKETKTILSRVAATGVVAEGWMAGLASVFDSGLGISAVRIPYGIGNSVYRAGVRGRRWNGMTKNSPLPAAGAAAFRGPRLRLTPPRGIIRDIVCHSPSRFPDIH